MTSRNPFQHRLPGQSNPGVVSKGERFVVRKGGPEETKHHEKHDPHFTSPPNSTINFCCQQLPLHWPGSLPTLMRKVDDGREVFLEAIPLHDILEEDFLDKQPGEQSLVW